MNLRGMSFVITGAAGGMGRAIAPKLAAEGASLTLADRDPALLERLQGDLKPYAAQVLTQVVDVTDEPSVRSLFEAAKAKFGGVDVLLNLAGLSIAGQIAEMPVEEYDRIMDVNLKAAFLCSKHFLSIADPQRDGLIVNIASVAAKHANANAPMYCTAKAAVAMFSEGLALHAKQKNVRVTTLLPGATDTPFWGDRKVPREKFMQADDIVSAIQFVLSLPPHVVVHELVFESFEFFKHKS
ncbi:MAG: SDR family oxidoreductase [Thermoguttaceae bacterium]